MKFNGELFILPSILLVLLCIILCCLQRHVEEDVLALTLPQLLAVVGYILKEASDKPESLTHRLPLLLRCCRGNSTMIQGVISHLYNSIKAQR